jgi:hypothetical protein
MKSNKIEQSVRSNLYTNIRVLKLVVLDYEESLDAITLDRILNIKPCNENEFDLLYLKSLYDKYRKMEY